MFLTNLFRPFSLEGNRELAKKLAWFDSFDFTSDLSAEFFHRYARDKFNEFDNSYSRLDDRANRLLQLTGAFVGVMVAGFVGLEVALPAIAAIPFVLFIIVMCIAANVQSPRHRTTTASVCNLLEVSPDVKAENFDIWMARHYYESTVKLLVPYTWKADCLKWANCFFVLGVAMLILIPFWNRIF